MKILKYNTGFSKTGLYCDLDKKGQAYNVLLFLQSVSKNKTGILKVSTKKEAGFLKLKRSDSNGFSTHYHFVDHPKLVHFSLDPFITTAKNIWVKAFPTTKTK